jgi:hypothetical protein
LRFVCGWLAKKARRFRATGRVVPIRDDHLKNRDPSRGFGAGKPSRLPRTKVVAFQNAVKTGRICGKHTHRHSSTRFEVPRKARMRVARTIPTQLIACRNAEGGRGF